ncbi:MAG: ComF family protein [Bacteroidetes bacterium]|nr:ComF family protein [Bacteroidota bacterium]
MSPILRTFNYFIDFFYPNVCLLCGDKITLNYKTKINPTIDSTKFCCSKCKAQIVFAGNKYEVTAEIIPNYSSENFAITNAVSIFKNTPSPPIINLIYGLKYKGYTQIGLEYGEWLGKVLVSEKMTDYNYIVPLPIHPARKRERGYNQSDYIALGTNKILNIKVASDLLKRTKHTTSQTLLKPKERLKNMENVFALNTKYNVAGMKILIVDDVLTTGATLNNCALTLLYNKAKQVDVATLLKA